MKPEDWIGYCEHRTPESLNEFEANVGKGGCTIFALMCRTRLNLMGLPWCVTFVHAVLDRPDVLGKPCPGVKTLYRRMKRRGLWRGTDYTPEPYDLVFCSNLGDGTLEHVGIVESADEKTVTSIDGNTHDDKGRFAWTDGGVVARAVRERTSPIITGYAATGRLLCKR